MGINNPSAGGGVWTLLHDETLGVAGRFDISGIAQTHNTLKIFLWARSDDAASTDNLVIHFNGDTTTANYRRATHIAGNSHTAAGTDDTVIANVPAANAPANYFAAVESFIMNYTGTHTKLNCSVFGERADGVIVAADQYVTHWEDTAAITQITIQTDNHDTDLIVAGSILQLYGLT